MGFTEAWLKYRHETFDFFSRFKGRTKRFWDKISYNGSFDSVQSWLESFMIFCNYYRLSKLYAA